MNVGHEVPFDILTAAAGPGQSAVNITGPSGHPVPCYVTTVPDGATAKFVPQEPGTHSVQVTFADQPVPNSPFTTVATQVSRNSVITHSSIIYTWSQEALQLVKHGIISGDHMEHF